MSRWGGFASWSAVAAMAGFVLFARLPARTDVHTPAGPASAAPAESLLLPPPPPPPASWSALRSLDGLEGVWVAEAGPAVDDAGVVHPDGAVVRFEKLGSAPPSHQRWTFYAALGAFEQRCTLLGESHGGFSGVCDGRTRAVSYHFASDDSGRLLFQEHAQVFVRQKQP